MTLGEIASVPDDERNPSVAAIRRWWWPTGAIWAFVTTMIAAGMLMRLVVPHNRDHTSTHDDRVEVRLPPAARLGGMALTEALARRRSHRVFVDRSLGVEELAQLCWSAQGISEESGGLRTAPSAGALYPITVFVVDRAGVHEYDPHAHALRSAIVGDIRHKMQTVALNQTSVGSAPVCFVITMDVSRTASKYGARAERYCLLEAGHVAQNMLLQATALKLGGVTIAAFNEEAIARLLELPPNLKPVYLLPMGQPRVH